jgi:glycosyltransferase involved in cell wall biosynthesis
MRILLSADPELPVPPTGYGGIERIVDGLVSDFREQGHSVGLIARPGSTAAAEVLFPWPGRSSRSAHDTLKNMLALRRAVRGFRPDVLHSFSRLAYLLPTLASDLPKVMSYQRHTGGRQIGIAARLGGASLRFTACSEFIAAMGRTSGGSWNTVPNFVDPSRHEFAPRVDNDAPLVFLSRVERIKGPHVAIAVARASGRRLLLAGNRAEHGPEREFWETEIEPHLGRDGIEWIGEVDDARKSALLARAAALVVPIQWDEPFGIVFVEALAAGTPVIACARGALPEIIDIGRTGYFMDTVEEGAAAVRRLPEIDRTACRRAAEARFSRDTCAAAYLAVYRGMLQGTG